MPLDPFAALGVTQAPPPSFAVVEPHAAPDGSGSMTNLSDEDYTKFRAGIAPSARSAPKKGIDPFKALGISPNAVAEPAGSLPDWAIRDSAEAAPAAPLPPPDKSTLSGIGAAIPAGLYSGVASAPNVPTHIINALNDLLTHLTGQNYGQLKAPIEQNPAGYQPHGTAERTTFAGAQAVGSLPSMAIGGEAAAPLLSGIPKMVARGVADASGPAAIAPVAAGAAAGQAASDAVPEPWKPVADIAGNVAGATSMAGAGSLLARAGGAIRNQANTMGIGTKTDIGGVRVTRGQAQAAGNQIAGALGPEGRQILTDTGAAETRARELEGIIANPPDPAAAAAAQQELTALRSRREVLVPGSAPTTAQLAPTPEAVGLEKAHRTAAQEPFMARAQEQNRARVEAVQAQAPADARPGAVGQFFTQQLDALEKSGQALIGQARAGVQSASERPGGTASPEAYGGEIRGFLGGANTAARAREAGLWDAVDPEGTLALPLGGVQQTARGLLKDMQPGLGDVASGQEVQILQGAAGLPPVVPFRDAQRLRSNIGFAERALRATPGNDQSLRRLGLLKQSLDGAIGDAAEAAAANDPGVAERLDALAQHEDGQELSGGSSGLGVAQGAPGAPDGVSGARGSQVPSRGGPRDAARDSGVASPQAIGGRGRQPESLIDFLIGIGGVSDPEGDLRALGADAIHHRQGGRLITPKGIRPDYARELLEGEGFLRPNSTIADYYNLVADHVSGRPVYRISEQAEGDARARLDREASRNDVAHEVASNAVNAAAMDFSPLSPAETEHATQLVMQGAHPEDAIRQAARNTEETVLDRNAQASAFGRPGVPAGAEQAEMPVPGGSRLAPNFDAEAASRYAAARQATLERKTTFGQGPVGKALRPGPGGAEYRAEDAAVPRLFLNGSPAEPANVRRYIEAVGGLPQAVQSMRNALVNDLREKGIIQPDGTIKLDAFRTWQQRRSRTIALFEGLGDSFADAETAQRTLDDVTAAHEQALKDFQRSSAASFIHDDPMVAVRKAFGTGNPAETFRQLVRAVRGNPDAEGGLRRAVVDFIAERTASMAPAGTDGVDFQKADVFRRWIRQNSAPLKAIFGGQGVQNFDMVAADLRRGAQRTTATAGSDTAQKLLGAHKAGLVPKVGHGIGLTALALMGEHLGSSLHGSMLASIGGAIALPLAGELLHVMRQAGIKTTNDLVREALLHPAVARELMVRTQGGQIGPVASQRIARAIQATLASGAATSQEKRQ